MAMPDFLNGVSACGSAAAGLFFLRYWRATGDRLFAFLAGGFWILALNWIALAIVPPPQESRHLAYLLRLVAFVLICGAIWDKNRDRGAT